MSYIAYGDVPSSPSEPTLVSSTNTSIAVSWTAPGTSDLPVSGYTLSMDDGQNGQFTKVFIGTNRPDILTYQVGGLTTGLPYQFYVQAMDTNGLSPASPIVSMYAC